MKQKSALWDSAKWTRQYGIRQSGIRQSGTNSYHMLYTLCFQMLYCTQQRILCVVFVHTYFII